MWNMNKHGFLSIVEYDPKSDRAKKSVFKKIATRKGSHMLVRGRIKEDLEDLRRVCPNLQVVEDLHADYMYRCVIPRRKLAQYMYDSVMDIDYGSHFKEVAEAHDPKYGKQRHTAYMRCWSALMELQPHKPWSGAKWYKDYDAKKPAKGTAKYASPSKKAPAVIGGSGAGSGSYSAPTGSWDPEGWDSGTRAPHDLNDMSDLGSYIPGHGPVKSVQQIVDDWPQMDLASLKEHLIRTGKVLLPTNTLKVDLDDDAHELFTLLESNVGPGRECTELDIEDILADMSAAYGDAAKQAAEDDEVEVEELPPAKGTVVATLPTEDSPADEAQAK